MRGLLFTSMQKVINAFRFYTTQTFEQVLLGDLFGVSVFATCTVFNATSPLISGGRRYLPDSLSDDLNLRHFSW